MIHRAFRYRIYPTTEQDSTLRQFAGAARFIYNLALEQRRDHWQQYLAATGKHISWSSQSREVTQLRAEVNWLAAVPRSICEQALRDLDQAYAHFFAGRCGFPKMRARGLSDAFRVQGKEARITVLNRKWATIRIPNCSAIKFRLTRPISGKVKNATVRLAGDAWHISFATEQEEPNCATSPLTVGIDRGIANTFSLSTGEHFQMPAHVTAATEKRKRAQRVLCRRKKGSTRRARQRLIVAKHHAHTASARSHWLHERSTDIARRYGMVTLEALRVRNMTAGGIGKRGLNRSILEQGWSAFATMLEYKLEARGGRVEYVNAAYTSQTCAECGSIDKRSRESQSVFRCVDCGHTAHADTNAALNILGRSPASAEVAGYGAGEARIGTASDRWENLAA